MGPNRIIAFYDLPLLFLALLSGCGDKGGNSARECEPGTTIPCTTPCGSEGLVACGHDGIWSECMIPPELYNGIDDDCDGLIDEICECIPGDTETCTTSCGSEGTRTCNDLTWWNDCMTPAETCNGMDDDCDGVPDNGFECVPGEGLTCPTSCGSLGSGTCTEACLIPDGDNCAPPEETCNGLDDDCDGTVDNGFACTVGDLETCTTSCRTQGTRSCSSSCTWNSCVPPEERCNDSDDDCDDFIDEEYGTASADTRVTHSTNFAFGHSFVFTGSEYGIAWILHRTSSNDILFARLSTSGAKIGSDVQVIDEPNFCETPSMVFTGSEFGIAWTDDRNDHDDEIYFARLSADGTKIGSDVRVTNRTGWSSQPSLAYTGFYYGVAWKYPSSGSDIYFTFLSSLGVKIGSDVLATSTTSGSCSSPFLVYSGSEFGLAWYFYNNPNHEIRFIRLTGSGSRIGSDLVLRSDTSSASSPFLLFTGSEYTVFWSDERSGSGEGYFAKISTEGELIGAADSIIDDKVVTAMPRAVFTGSEYGICFSTTDPGYNGIVFTRMTPVGVRLDPGANVSDDAEEPYTPHLVYTGSVFGAAWSDSRYLNSEIFFNQIACID